MAIDMSTVKAILHNNKDVTKIQDSLGNVLWQKSVRVLRKDRITLYFAASGTTYPTYTIVSSGTTSPYTSYMTLPSITNIKSQIESATGISASDVNSITSATLTFSSRQSTISGSTPHVDGRTSSSSSVSSGLPGSSIYTVSVLGTSYVETMFTTSDIKSFLLTSSNRNVYLYKSLVSSSRTNAYKVTGSAGSTDYGYTFNSSGSKGWYMTIDYTYYAEAYYIKYNGYYLNLNGTTVEASTTRTTTWSVGPNNHIVTEVNGVTYYLGADNTSRAQVYTSPTDGSYEVFGTANSYIYYTSSYGTSRLRYYSSSWQFNDGSYTVTWEQ